MGLYIFRCGSLFRGSFWNYTSKHIGGIAMAGRKEYRDLTVGDIYRNGKSVPMLRISGLWLEELGFKTGDFVRIKCEDGQLIISLNEEKAQQVAEEKAFMEEEMKKLQKRYQKEKEQIHARFVAEREAVYCG
jgi:toxic protein SymE